jgi:uncharacterized membrane protein
MGKDLEALTFATAPADVLTEKRRIESIDIMRGIVMVIMALDHARAFYHADAMVFDPTNLEKTTPALFFTRIVTHFCAPTFVLLAGTAIRIQQERKSKQELSKFLLTRGMWLILLEVTVVRFSMFFQLYYDVVMFQVIWAIGASMVAFALVIHLSFNAILISGLLITFGHDLLHKVDLQATHPFFVPWTFIHQANGIELFPGTTAWVNYPFLPWFGILLLGYCLGEWFRKDFDPTVREKRLLATGACAILLFLALRYFNGYGDPAPWAQQKNGLYTLLSFLNVTKYPPSLLYTLATLGPVLMVLPLLEKVHGAAARPFAVIGRVPLFYYILHFYLLHAGALFLHMSRSGLTLNEIDFHIKATFGGIPAGAGYALVWSYVAAITVVIILYPVCAWYYRYKRTHTHWWLSYL